MSLISGMIRTMAAVPCVHLANPAKNAEEISALLDIADQRGVKLCVFPEGIYERYELGQLGGTLGKRGIVGGEAHHFKHRAPRLLGNGSNRFYRFVAYFALGLVDDAAKPSVVRGV